MKFVCRHRSWGRRRVETRLRVSMSCSTKFPGSFASMTAIKESSDELNPPQSVPATEIPAPKSRGAADLLALAIATCGVGYLPIAPGTIGSLVGVGFYLAVWGALY